MPFDPDNPTPDTPSPVSPTPNPEVRLGASKPKVLIVDDDEDLRTQMKWALVQDYEVILAEDRQSALKAFQKKKPDVVTLDLGLPPRPAHVEEGFATLSEILTLNPMSKVIVITGRGEKEHALKAVADGAYDFLHKPVEIDELKVVLKRAIYLAGLEREHREIQDGLSREGFQGMIGSSPQMQEIFMTIKKVATSDVPILITGESGTGKELVARAIHNLSGRKNGPFIPINCGAIPENLIESELFGHEKGAYTGAHVQRKGKIEMAQLGTLFLDEIGELPHALQVKLLRFLQEQMVERIGGREMIHVDTRVLTATNRDIKEAMGNGSFREDLYFRIGVITIQLPRLRERAGDVLLLSQAFLRRYAKEGKKKLTGFTREAIDAIEGYDWPGNVRELENKIKRAVVMAEGTRVKPEDLEMGSSEEKQPTGLKEAREALERKMVLDALARNQDSISQTADDLGVSRPTLYDLMSKLGIKK
jgi:two-component system, NtrC family, response regulator